MRGSRKHVLDWTALPTFADDLVELVHPVNASLSAHSVWMPRGPSVPQEARLEIFGPKAIAEVDWPQLRRWWLRHPDGANTPNWDIALQCSIEKRPGLILVEAKANVPELGSSGKAIRPQASQASQGNHKQIGNAIDEACAALRRLDTGIAISRDSHYQLSNRATFAWKLASMGVPTVVMYLGFIGDTGIADAGEPFKTEKHWQDVFADYAYGIVPRALFERRIDCGAAPMWLLVRSRAIAECSPPPLPRIRPKHSRQR